MGGGEEEEAEDIVPCLQSWYHFVLYVNTIASLQHSVMGLSDKLTDDGY